MLWPAVAPENRDLYVEGLVGSYEMRTSVHILDLDHNLISDVSDLLYDGHVESELVEADEEDTDDLLEAIGVETSVNLTLLDPARTVALDSRSPADAAIYMDRMVRCVVSTRLPGLGWVDHHVFTGPITKLDRDGLLVQVEGQSKERLALGNYNVGDKKYTGVRVDAARQMLLDTGEQDTYIDFPDDPTRLDAPVQFKRETRAWSKVWRVAQSMSRTAYYDGRGVARMRELSMSPVWSLDGRWITNEIQVGYDTSDFANAVRVRGRATTGSKRMIDLTEYLLDDNPNSAARIGRGGKPRYLVEFLFPTDLANKAEGLKLAKDTLADKAATIADTAFDCHPIWGLEVGDLLDVNTTDYIGETRVTKMRKPLTCRDGMLIGYLLPVVTPSSAAIRSA